MKVGGLIWRYGIIITQTTANKWDWRGLRFNLQPSFTFKGKSL